jgi:hypothetical protein
MGRASNHKKARRSGAHATRRIDQDLKAEGKRQLLLVASMHAVNEAYDAYLERYRAACRVWCGGRNPVPAKMPWWVEGALGRGLLANQYVAEAQEAPCLLTADVPDDGFIAADPAHWHVAINALVRAVVFDGLEAAHPAVSALTAALAPVVETEVGCREAVGTWLLAENQRRQRVPQFPVLDGPLLILGELILAESTLAVVGDEPGSEELAVLSRALDGMIPGMAGSVVAETMPREDPIQAMIISGVMTPGKVLETGVRLLSALVQICANEAAPAARRVA